MRLAKLKPPPPSKPIVERAFEIARAGIHPTVYDLEGQLWREGYTKGDVHLNSPSLRKQLRALCTNAPARRSKETKIDG